MEFYRWSSEFDILKNVQVVWDLILAVLVKKNSEKFKLYKLVPEKILLIVRSYMNLLELVHAEFCYKYELLTWTHLDFCLFVLKIIRI